MLKAKDGEFFISDWLRNRNTLEYIGIWEELNNPNFNYGEFALIKSQSGLNRFKISVKEFVAQTNAINGKTKRINPRPENSGLFICLTIDNTAHIGLRYPHFQQKVGNWRS